VTGPYHERFARYADRERHANYTKNIQTIQGGPRKVKPTTILLVTFECVGKIQ